MTRRTLPIGIQTFREIREGDFYYVDKTGFALRLIAEGKYFFLSRPRRFGKSLLLDTLAELFEGNAALFAGLCGQVPRRGSADASHRHRAQPQGAHPGGLRGGDGYAMIRRPPGQRPRGPASMRRTTQRPAPARAGPRGEA
jgi:hypothetical protein